MSHFGLEIVMPPTDDIDKAVASIMERFRIRLDGGPDEMPRYSFWDDYHICQRNTDKVKTDLPEGVCLVKDLPFGFESYMLILAEFCEAFGRPVTRCLLYREIESCFTKQNTDWAGDVYQGIQRLAKQRSITVGPDWLAVTVDCHD